MFDLIIKEVVLCNEKSVLTFFFRLTNSKMMGYLCDFGKERNIVLVLLGFLCDPLLELFLLSCPSRVGTSCRSFSGHLGVEAVMEPDL